jgi:hypothetical protein
MLTRCIVHEIDHDGNVVEGRRGTPERRLPWAIALPLMAIGGAAGWIFLWELPRLIFALVSGG